MKNFFPLPIIFIIAYISQLFLPWWVIAVISFSVCYLASVSKFVAFTNSLFAIFVLWYFKAWLADGNFDEPMSVLLGNILGEISGGAVLFLTASIGGITAGLSGLLGSWTNSLFSKK